MSFPDTWLYIWRTLVAIGCIGVEWKRSKGVKTFSLSGNILYKEENEPRCKKRKVNITCMYSTGTGKESSAFDSGLRL
jgi:hypothetical protein